MRTLKNLFCVIIVMGLFFGLAAFAQDAPKQTEIVLGQSCALSGPAEALGKGMSAGLNACFDKINAEGGVNGVKIKLISKDDGYEPDKAITVTKELITRDKVFALIGGVGTPTSKAVMPTIAENKIPFIAAFTGAKVLRSPEEKAYPYIINVRASYGQETEKLAALLVDQKKFTKIACFYQNDDYGLAGLNGIKDALTKRKMELVATGSYERNTTAVKSGLLDIRKSQPEAIVMVGAYKACAEFIKLARKAGLKDSLFCNISFVGTDALLKELGEDGEGVIISQVVASPQDASIEIVKEYQETMKKYKPNEPLTFVSLEGFIAAKFFCQALKGVSGPVTPSAFIAAVEKQKDFDLGGLKMSFGPNDHQGLDDVFLTVIKGGKVEPLKD